VRLNPKVPTELERIVNKCLEKNRNLRYQHASEMRADLQRLKRDTESGKSGVEAQVVPQAWRARLGWLAGLAAVAIVAGALYRLFPKSSAIPFQNVSLTKITENGNAPLAIVSPDVKYYSARR
jgi:hypothetical protein